MVLLNHLKKAVTGATVAALTSAAALSSGSMVGTAAAGPEDSAMYNTVDRVMRKIISTGVAKDFRIPLPDADKTGFYRDLPRYIDGKPGQLLRREPTNFAFMVPLYDYTNSEAERVAYVTKNYKGRTVPATGTIIRTKAPWKGPGPRPLLLLAPGTQGSSDSCAPSKLLPWGVEYDAPIAALALLRGWNVALVDYIGLGTGNQNHTYMVREDQGHALLDMARATVAMNLPDIGANTPMATFGYSQGGGGSAAALELAAPYAPELNIIGGYAGGVPANLAKVAEKLDNGPLIGFMGYALNGYRQNDPELQRFIPTVLSAEGQKFLNDTANECMIETLPRYAFSDSRKWSTDGRTTAEILRDEPFASISEAQTLGKVPPRVPVLVGHSTHDDSIPVEQSREMAHRWCTAGARIKYLEQNNPQVGPLMDHLIPMGTLIGPAFEWVDSLAKGKPVSFSSCSDIPAADAQRPRAPKLPVIPKLPAPTLENTEGGRDLVVNGAKAFIGSIPNGWHGPKF